MVVVVMGVLTAIGARAVGPAMDGYSVRSARTTLATMVQRARVHAIEGAGLARLHMDFAGDSAWIVVGTDVKDTFRFDEELGVDVQSATANAWVCMNSKGFADPRCTSFTNRFTISFVSNTESTSMDVLPLGQVIF